MHNFTLSLLFNNATPDTECGGHFSLVALDDICSTQHKVCMCVIILTAWEGILKHYRASFSPHALVYAKYYY